MKKLGSKFSKPWRVIAGLLIFGILLTFIIASLLQDKDIPVLNPSGIIASQQKDLLIFTVVLSLFVVVPVYVMMATFAWRYREKGGKGAYMPDEKDNKLFEALWWGVPIVIICILGVITWISSHELDPNKPIKSTEKALNVQVVALQWRWLFIYPDYNIATINELRMPVGVPVNFRLTADGPMSAFWIPALGTQTYAMSAMSSKLSLQADKVGSFRGSNTNITGTGYSDMNFRVVSVPSRDSFHSWAKSIASNKQKKHLDWQMYENVSEPIRDKTVYYFHLHDNNLYSKIVEKFGMAHGNTAETNMKEHEGHE